MASSVETASQQPSNGSGLSPIHQAHDGGRSSVLQDKMRDVPVWVWLVLLLAGGGGTGQIVTQLVGGQAAHAPKPAITQADKDKLFDAIHAIRTDIALMRQAEQQQAKQLDKHLEQFGAHLQAPRLHAHPRR